MNAIRIGKQVINCDHVALIDFGAEAITIHMVDGVKLDQIDPASAEGQALEWYFLEAERAFHMPGLTIDVVWEHRRALKQQKDAEDLGGRLISLAATPNDGAYSRTVRSHEAMRRNGGGYPVWLGRTKGGASA